MFRKIITASAVALFFACSSDDNSSSNGNNTSSSSEQGGSGDSSSSNVSGDNNSSSSATSEISTVTIIGTGKLSLIFNTYLYGYTLKADSPEDLEQFWDTENCPTGKQTTKPDASCQLDSTNTILRNKLTTLDAALHYDVPFTRVSTTRGYVELREYILTEDGDQAALGLNVYQEDNNPKNIEDLKMDNLNGTTAFIYKYAGGAHSFRAVSKKDSDFWYKEAPATQSITDTATIRITVSELAGMGSFAENEGKEETAFDISQVAKFLWVVPYDSKTESKNRGSLRIESLSAETQI
jgi:hypothetical protein